MAVNGQLAFPNAAAAEEGTQNFARAINRIDLRWGDDFARRSSYQSCSNGRAR
jgi:hypothetical protein